MHKRHHMVLLFSPIKIQCLNFHNWVIKSYGALYVSLAYKRIYVLCIHYSASCVNIYEYPYNAYYDVRFVFASICLQEASCLHYLCCLRIVVSNTYCVVFLLCFSSFCVPYVASFSGFSVLSIFDCPFRHSLTFTCVNHYKLFTFLSVDIEILTP